jgi:DNA-binding transcriptional MerR regulator
VAGTTELWTLDQLTELVESALAVDYPGQVNGRVRAVPDRRAIRWYSTIGLVDRPAEMRGRTALYGRRHLLQLVSIKRLQSQGRTLAEIQAELAGATDRTLRTIAALPSEPAVGGAPTAPEPAQESVRKTARESARGLARGSARELAPEAAQKSARARFWTDRPAALNADGAERVDGTALVTAVRLAAGVTVVLDGIDVPPAQLNAEQLSALRSAAAPLLAELARQHLTAQRESGDPT